LAFSNYRNCAPKTGNITVNGVIVWQGSGCNGNSPSARGVFTLLVDPLACFVKESHNFDTHISSTNGERLRDYLNRLDRGSVIVAVTADEASNHIRTADSVLRQQFGVQVRDVRYRGSFAFVAQKGYPDKTVLSKAVTETESHSAPAHVVAIVTTDRGKHGPRGLLVRRRIVQNTLLM